MLRVLKENKDDIVMCRTCNCVYDYEYNDLLILPGVGYLVRCPKCGQELILVNDELREKELIVEVKGDETC